MENVILMASGMGTRMRPLTNTIPKPLIKVDNLPMIESIMEGLIRRGIDNIFVVVGYLGEQFRYLQSKYKNVHIIENTVYETVNNISSVYAAREVLKQGSCFVCEADLYVSDTSIFLTDFKESCYYGKMVKGHSDDWVFDLDKNGIITRVGKGGDNCFNMTGISYFTETDAKVLYHAVLQEYGNPGYEILFWDDVVNKHIDKFQLKVYPVNHGQVFEIDTVEDLKAVRDQIKEKAGIHCV